MREAELIKSLAKCLEYRKSFNKYWVCLLIYLRNKYLLSSYRMPGVWIDNNNDNIPVTTTDT